MPPPARDRSYLKGKGRSGVMQAHKRVQVMVPIFQDGHYSECRTASCRSSVVAHPLGFYYHTDDHGP